MKFINKLLRDEAGATAIEYGLIAALIAVAAITALGTLGNNLSNTFSSVSTELEAPANKSAVATSKRRAAGQLAALFYLSRKTGA